MRAVRRSDSVAIAPAIKMVPAMAKKAKATVQPQLFPEFRRRHRHLVLPKLLTEKAIIFPFDDARLNSAVSELQRWADLASQGVLQQKETSLDAEFLRIIFGQALIPLIPLPA